VRRDFPGVKPQSDRRKDYFSGFLGGFWHSFG
jgi:hypothetical protein